ncbi:transporter [Sporolactobacillus sp. CPB3-1]|uniref:Transporter n=1 Tax=Sporolactobacillus mangiferae TaxID=2940498 RepID=A0ABT0MCR8_9BACL|nr:transporter [Sporolactobacillus mangiferae]MCL1632676.1 transporter [Sporolactobacillus mangiferae]
MKRKLLNSLQVAATFIGTIVGAGFASGREIIQFFTQYHGLGTIGAIMSGIFMTWVGTKMMIYARRIHAYSFNELLTALFGRQVGNVIQALLFFIILSITGVMLAGSGAVFAEQIGWSRELGIFVTVFFAGLFLVRGVRGLLLVNVIVVPLLIGLIFFAFWTNGTGAQIFPESRHIRWFLASFNYAAFNLSTALVVLVPMAMAFKDEQVIRWGGIIGGLGLTLILVLSHLMLSGKSGIELYELPMAEMVRPFGTLLHFTFVTVIFGEILTTFVGNIFGMTRQLCSIFPALFSLRTAMCLLLVCTMIIGQFSYSSLIATLYPLNGVLCAFVFVYMCMVRLPEKHR